VDYLALVIPAPPALSEYKIPERVYVNTSVIFYVNVSKTVYDIDTVWISGNWSGSWENHTIQAYSGTQTERQYNYTVGYGNFTQGEVVGWKFYANDTKGFLAQTTLHSFVVWGWSQIDGISAPNFTHVGRTVEIACNVSDYNTSLPISNYPVNFYKDDSLIGTAITDSNGVATYYWDTSGETTGEKVLKCTISEDSNLHYTPVISEATTTIFTNRTIYITIFGNGTRVGARTYQYVNLTLNFYDPGYESYRSNVSGRIWVEKSDGVWEAFDCVSDNNGNCTVKFNPDCSYDDGWRRFLGGTFNDSYYADVNTSYAWVYVDTVPYCANKITFTMEFNISGKENDLAEIDHKGIGVTGTYYSGELDDNFVCAYDSISKATFGIVFSGKYVYYVKLENSTNGYLLEMSQYEPGNKFILPITSNSCNDIKSKIRDISKLGYLSRPFSDELIEKGLLEIVLDYPEIDIVGENIQGSDLTVVLEKNESVIPQIIARRK